MLPIHITVTERNPADISARAHARCATAAWQAVGEEWQQRLLPPRLRPGAHYPHRQRTAKYQAQKEGMARRGTLIGGRPVLYGGLVTNVLTGNMAELLMRPAAVRAFPTRATVRKIGPVYVTMKPFKSNQPDKWAELTYVNQDEKALLIRVWKTRYAREVQQLRETRVTTV